MVQHRHEQDYFIYGGGIEFEEYLAVLSLLRSAVAIMLEPKIGYPAAKIGRVFTLLLFCAEDCLTAHGAIIELLKCITSLQSRQEWRC